MRQSGSGTYVLVSVWIVAVSLVVLGGCLPSPQAPAATTASAEPTSTNGPYPSFDPTPEPVVEGNLFESGIGFTASATEPSEPSPEGSGYTFEPLNVTDGDMDTAWKTDRAEWDFDDYILITFEQPVILSHAGLTAGFAANDAQSGDDPFTQNHRLCFARFTFSDGSEWEIELDQSDRAVQSIEVEVRTQWVKVGDFYACAGEDPPAQDDFLAISEVELVGTPAT